MNNQNLVSNQPVVPLTISPIPIIESLSPTPQSVIPLPVNNNKKKKIIFVGLIVVVAFLIAVSVFLYFNRNKETPVTELTPPPKEYAMAYVKDEKLYAATADGTKIDIIEDKNVDEFVSIAPNGSMFEFRRKVYVPTSTVAPKEDEGGPDYTIKTVIKKKSGEELVIDGYGGGEWSADSHYILESNLDYAKEDPSWERQIIDLSDLSVTKIPNPEMNYLILAMMNNKHVLLTNNLEDRRTEDENVELFEWDPIANTRISLAKVKFSSPLGELSPDNTKITYSDGLNVRITDFATKSIKQFMNYTDSNSNFVWNTLWSPDNSHVAFNVNGINDSLGIADLTTNEVTLLPIEKFTEMYEEKDKKQFLISYLAPGGWDTKDKLFIRTEATYVEGDYDSKRKDKYWLYDLNSKQITPLPWIDDLAVSFTNKIQ